MKRLLVIGFGLLIVRVVVTMLSTTITYPEIQHQTRVHFALKSADYFLRSGVPMMLQSTDGTVQPIEEIWPDDQGQTVMLHAIAASTRSVLSRIAVKRLNVFLNAACLTVLVLVFWKMGLRTVALAALLVGTWSTVPGPFPGAEGRSIYIGLYMLTLAAFLLSAGHLRQEWNSIGAHLVVTFLVIVCLGLACLFRKAIGLIGIISIVIYTVLSAQHYLRPRLRFFANLGLIVIGLMAAYYLPAAVIKLRNITFDIPRPKISYFGHGFGHNVLIGLGLVPNSFGLRWDDASGEKYMQKKHPHVGFMSDEYFSLVWREYAALVRQRPMEVAGIYFRKSLISLANLQLPWLLGLLQVFATVFLTREIWLKPIPVAITLAFGAGVSSLLVLLQGVVAWTIPDYIYPAKFGVQIFWISLVIAGIDRFVRQPRK